MLTSDGPLRGRTPLAEENREKGGAESGNGILAREQFSSKAVKEDRRGFCVLQEGLRDGGTGSKDDAELLRLNKASHEPLRWGNVPTEALRGHENCDEECDRKVVSVGKPKFQGQDEEVSFDCLLRRMLTSGVAEFVIG